MVRVACAGLVLLLASLPVGADTEPRWTLHTSLLTHHFHPQPYHTENQQLVALEYHLRPQQMRSVGGASFRNTFDQRSYYLYVSRRYNHPEWPVYARVTGGLLYGYRGDFRRRVPLNQGGFSPGIVPMVGVQVSRFQSELVLFGLAGVMVKVGISF
ncbi:sn-glycerol-3-phosphate transporter [Marinimicrobium alkaliphilum]|uniref:sn-glycerol-3-phosphate transporter n=1 Tax=Marinimicrobium alkaliphilum TaxID=2202654 RepID=UPI0013005BF2|nr:sn-glycerol-3-phosphate transporter [Marinimicrobium alkaliphilum]